MKLKQGKLVGFVALALSATALLAACYTTVAVVCVPAGTVLSSTPVQCRAGSLTATLYDQTYTTQDAITFDTVAATGWGRTGKISVTVVNTVGIGTRTIDPNTCDITINPNAGSVAISCGGSVEDPNSAPCLVAMNQPPSSPLLIALANEILQQ
jgi:hypothetical protein